MAGKPGTTYEVRDRLTPIIVLRVQAGEPLSQIAADLGISAKTVRRWWDRATDTAPLPPRAIPHGTTSGWQYHKCRCKECLSARAEYKRAEKAQAAQKPVGDGMHGTRSGLWRGCDCPDCRSVARDDRRGQQARTRETAVNHGEVWTEADDEIALRPGVSIEEKAVLLGRTWAAVENRLRWWERRTGLPWQEIDPQTQK